LPSPVTVWGDLASGGSSALDVVPQFAWAAVPSGQSPSFDCVPTLKDKHDDFIARRVSDRIHAGCQASSSRPLAKTAHNSLNIVGGTTRRYVKTFTSDSINLSRMSALIVPQAWVLVVGPGYSFPLSVVFSSFLCSYHPHFLTLPTRLPRNRGQADSARWTRSTASCKLLTWSQTLSFH